MHLEVVEGINGHWFVRLVGGNGEPVMTSELYSSKSNAERSAYDIRDDMNKGWTVEVRSPNDE